MPQITLDATGPSKGSLVEGGYDFCGLSGDQFERTPEEMSKGLRFLNDLMASLKDHDGIDLGYVFPDYGDGLLEEPSGIPLSARRPVCALLAQSLAPTIGVALTEDAKAVLATALAKLRAYSAPAPVSRKPSSSFFSVARRHNPFRCLCPEKTTTPAPAPTPTPVVTTPQPPATPSLNALTLSANTVTENSVANVVVGAILGLTSGSQVTLSDSAGNRFAISGSNLVTGAVPTNYEAATSHSITLLETLNYSGGQITRSTPLTVNVTNLFEQPSLGTLTLSQTSFTVGISASGTINGATLGSGIAATGLPSGITIDGNARTFAYDGIGAPASGNITLIETLVDSPNSPNPSLVSYTISSIATRTLSAPALGYPTTSNPPTLTFAFDADWQVGYTAKLDLADNANFTGKTTLTHVITATDATNKTISFPIPTLTSTPTFFQGYGNDGTGDSVNKSVAVAWGDSTPPIITNTATSATPGQVTETQKLWDPITTTDSGAGVPQRISDGVLPGVFIQSGADQLKFDLAVRSGVVGLIFVGDGAQDFSNPTDQGFDNKYDVTIGVIDRAGNLQTKALQYQVLAADKTPDAFSWGANVTGASLNQTIQAPNTWTVSGLGTGINAPLSATGPIRVSVDGGSTYTPWGSPPSTAKNGDLIQAEVVSSASYLTTTSNAVTVGTLTAAFTVTTQADATAASFVASSNQPGPVNKANTSASATFSADFQAGYPVVCIPSPPSGRSVTGITVNGSALTNRTPGAGGSTGIWVGSTPLSGGVYSIVVNYNGFVTWVDVMTGTLINTTNPVPTSWTESPFVPGSSTSAAALTVPAQGVGIAFCEGQDQNHTVTATTGSQVAQGLLDYYKDLNGTGTAGNYGAALSRQSTAGSWTASFAQSGGGYMHAIAIAFGAS